MEARELRIGNWLEEINNDDPNEFVQVEEIVVLENRTNVNNCSIEFYKPIPLTRKLLEKAGFDYYAWENFLDFTHMTKENLILRFHHDGASVFNFSACDSSKKQFVVSIQYLHELQNGFYFITKKELEINL